MRVLALDTASPSPALALVEVSGARAVRERIRNLPPAAAEALAPELQQLLADAGLDARALDRVAVLSGPGSFTGLRAGLAFARGLARALEIPLLPIRTFRAVAEALAEPRDADFLLDAGRGDVHRARRRGGALTEDAAPVASAQARADATADGVPAIDLEAPGRSLAGAAARLAAGAPLSGTTAAPTYGRKSAAEEKLERRGP
jgi:tRNA threonylcarbamoyladenosine biosynthesis protein TsaB